MSKLWRCVNHRIIIQLPHCQSHLPIYLTFRCVRANKAHTSTTSFLPLEQTETKTKKNNLTEGKKSTHDVFWWYDGNMMKACVWLTLQAESVDFWWRIVFHHLIIYSNYYCSCWCKNLFHGITEIPKSNIMHLPLNTLWPWPLVWPWEMSIGKHMQF